MTSDDGEQLPCDELARYIRVGGWPNRAVNARAPAPTAYTSRSRCTD